MTALLDNRIKVRPSDLVQKLFKLDGKPFSIEEYPYLHAIYNTNSNETGVFTGRQVAKSTFLSTKMVTKAVTYPTGTHQILVTPLQEQAYTFATLRLSPLITGSPIIKNGFFTGENV